MQKSGFSLLERLISAINTWKIHNEIPQKWSTIEVISVQAIHPDLDIKSQYSKHTHSGEKPLINLVSNFLNTDNIYHNSYIKKNSRDRIKEFHRNSNARNRANVLPIKFLKKTLKNEGTNYTNNMEPDLSTTKMMSRLWLCCAEKTIRLDHTLLYRQNQVLYYHFHHEVSN